MRRQVFAVLGILVVMLSLVSAPFAGRALADKLEGADTGGRLLTTELTGANEVPGPGDPDGSGSARITLNVGRGTVCWQIEVSGIASATAAHIHRAPVGVAGPVVVPLSPPSSGESSGCVDVDRTLVKDILQHPADFYVNVHNAEYPAGALRGQLG